MKEPLVVGTFEPQPHTVVEAVGVTLIEPDSIATSSSIPSLSFFEPHI